MERPVWTVPSGVNYGGKMVGYFERLRNASTRAFEFGGAKFESAPTLVAKV